MVLLAEQNVPNSQCPLCAGQMSFLFAALDHQRPEAPEKWTIVWCARCRYGKLAARLTADDVSRFYAFDYYTHSRHPDTRNSGPCKGLPARLRLHLAWLFDNGRELSPSEAGPPGRLCDIGCGNGRNMRMFRDAGFAVTGVEPDPQARRIASEFGTVYQGAAESLPQEIGCDYDYALLSHVLEHTLSPVDALRQVRRILKRGGKVIIEVPNCDALGFRVFGATWPCTCWDVPRHIHFFTKRSLDLTLAQAGFRRGRVYYMCYTRQFSDEWLERMQLMATRLRGTRSSRAGYDLAAWWLLARTLLAPAALKYDCVRVHAIAV